MPQPHDISSIEDLFSLWPLPDMARDLGIEYQTVAKWSQRKRIPPESWNAVIAAAQKKDIALSSAVLNKLNRPRRTALSVEVRE